MEADEPHEPLDTDDCSLIQVPMERGGTEPGWITIVEEWPSSGDEDCRSIPSPEVEGRNLVSISC